MEVYISVASLFIALGSALFTAFAWTRANSLNERLVVLEEERSAKAKEVSQTAQLVSYKEPLVRNRHRFVVKNNGPGKATSVHVETNAYSPHNPFPLDALVPGGQEMFEYLILPDTSGNLKARVSWMHPSGKHDEFEVMLFKLN